MYISEMKDPPKDEKQMWETFWNQFVYACYVFEAPLETAEEAGRGDYRTDALDKGAMRVIKHRGVSSDYCNRDEYYELGRSLIPTIERQLKKEKITLKFIQDWALFQFCHGYSAAHYFDDSDVSPQHRGGHATGKQRSKEAQREWIAKLIVPLIDKGFKRKAAEEIVCTHIQRILKNQKFPRNFNKEWFAPIITRGELAATYDEKHFSIKKMRKVIENPKCNIPPTKLKLP